MVNIQLYSANEDFKDDLTTQINRFTECVIVNDGTPDVVVIDDDKDLYLKKRVEYPSVPILFLTSENTQTEDNLNIIIQKPFLLVRFLDLLRSVNNKLDNSVDGVLTFNDYELHPNQKEITDVKTGKTAKLTEKEVSIIKYLYKMRSDFVSKADLQTNVWKYNENATTHTVETHIYRLRQKIELNDRKLIITESGKYKLNME